MRWERDTSLGCSNKNEDIVVVSGAPGSYDLEGLEEGNAYRVRILQAASEGGSSEPSNSITASTKERGENES